MKYGKPIWQLVAEAADRLAIEVFTFSDIVKGVHEVNREVPEISIKSYVTAMAPNHPWSLALCPKEPPVLLLPRGWKIQVIENC